jgi:uncharacterized protein with HEPN domain
MYAPTYPISLMRAARSRPLFPASTWPATESRLIRSSVEREFIIIGEAIAALSHVSPPLFEAISNARRIVDFRNQLTHEYPTVDDALVWAIVTKDVALLRKESASLLGRPDIEPSEQ